MAHPPIWPINRYIKMQTNVMAIQSTDAFKGMKHLPGVNKNICLQTYIEDNPHFLTILYVIFWENIADTD